MTPNLQSQLHDTVQSIRQKSDLRPRLGLILGSGLGNFIDEIDITSQIPYVDIPGFETTTVEGHAGTLILGYFKDIPIAALQGRIHFYEGHSMATVVYPTRTLAMLGIEVLMLTNSAGSLDPKLCPGGFLVIRDHINLMGENPLMGPNIKHLGPRFPDLTEAYDKRLAEKMAQILSTMGVDYQVGTYCAMSGPTYETPAEVRFLQLIGGQAVGMSTVPEAVAANHLGVRVCALSCISNLAAGLSAQKLSHDDVIKNANLIGQKFCTLMKEFVPLI